MNKHGGVTSDDTPGEATKKRSAAASILHGNREKQFILVTIEGTSKPYFYTCSHAAAAHHLSHLLHPITCSEEALVAWVNSNSWKATTCKKRISRLDIQDREKAELLGDTHALEEAYRASPAFRASQDRNRKKRAKHAGKGKGKNALLP